MTKTSKCTNFSPFYAIFVKFLVFLNLLVDCFHAAMGLVDTLLLMLATVCVQRVLFKAWF